MVEVFHFLGMAQLSMGIESRNSPIRFCMRIVAYAAVALAVYCASYLALLESKVYWQVGIDSSTGQNIFSIAPRYRVGGASLDAFFFVAHILDRRLRAPYWETIEHSSGRKWKNPSTAQPTIKSVGDSSEPGK